MILAQMAEIQVFATGGIGGVHRGATETFDISADLQELARTQVAVVSAGAKAILDLGLTLEYMETMGVPVVGVGTNDFPAFYTRSSPYKVPMRLDSPKEIAALLRAHWELGLGSGADRQSIPEEFSMEPSMIEASINRAIEQKPKGSQGKS